MPLIPLSGKDASLPPTEKETDSEPSLAEVDDSNRNEQVEGGVEDDDGPERAMFRRLVTTTTRALDNILEFRYSTVDDLIGEDPSKVFMFGCAGDASNYQFVMRVQPKHFTVICSSPLRIPLDQRAHVAEFIVRVNFAIVRGHFDLDFSDGELRFRVAQDNIPGLADDPDRVAHLFGVTLAMMDVHFPAIMKVMYGGLSPEQAVRSLEAHRRSGGSGSGGDTDDAVVQ
jgi:hypothetical protein